MDSGRCGREVLHFGRGDESAVQQFEQPFEHEEKLAAAAKRQQELDAFVSGANGLCKKLDGSMVVTRQPLFRLFQDFCPGS